MNLLTHCFQDTSSTPYTWPPLEHGSIVHFCEAVVEWTRRYPQTSIFIVLEGDVHAPTDETVYTDPESTVCHASAESVSFVSVILRCEKCFMIEFITDSISTLPLPWGLPVRRRTRWACWTRFVVEWCFVKGYPRFWNSRGWILLEAVAYDVTLVRTHMAGPNASFGQPYLNRI
jgi:hypothetical protein